MTLGKLPGIAPAQSKRPPQSMVGLFAVGAVSKKLSAGLQNAILLAMVLGFVSSAVHSALFRLAGSEAVSFKTERNADPMVGESPEDDSEACHNTEPQLCLKTREC